MTLSTHPAKRKKKSSGTLMVATTARATYWLGGEKAIGHRVHTEMDYHLIGKQGLSREAIEELIAALGISRKRMAEDVLSVSVKTIERKTGKDKFDPQISSHAIEVAKLFQHAIEIFEDEEKVRKWIDLPNAGLQNHTPIDLMSTMTGIRMVDTVLTRIEEGVYS